MAQGPPPNTRLMPAWIALLWSQGVTVVRTLRSNEGCAARSERSGPGDVFRGGHPPE